MYLYEEYIDSVSFINALGFLLLIALIITTSACEATTLPMRPLRVNTEKLIAARANKLPAGLQCCQMNTRLLHHYTDSKCWVALAVHTALSVLNHRIYVSDITLKKVK